MTVLNHSSPLFPDSDEELEDELEELEDELLDEDELEDELGCAQAIPCTVNMVKNI